MAEVKRVSEHSAHDRPSVRVLIGSGARVVLIVALLLAAYLWVPIRHDSPVVRAVTWAALLALVALIGVFVYQTRRINRSTYPLLAGAETLIVVLAIFLIGFAFVYLALSTSVPDAFSEPLNRTGALYFSITVLSTVGFGDITPKSDPSRWLVSAQMLVDVVLLAGVVRVIVGIARRADQRKKSGDEGHAARPSD